MPILLLLLTLCVHGLALINHSVSWDSVLLYGFYTDHNASELHRLMFSIGLPPFYYIHRLLWSMNYLVITNYIGVLSIYCMGLFTYLSARLFPSVQRSTAAWMSVFVIVFPGSLITFYHAITAYYIMCVFFMAAFYLALKSMKVEDVRVRWCLRILSLFLFFMSFHLKSLVVFYLLFILCAYLLVCPRSLYAFLKQHLDYVLLPVLFAAFCHLFYSTTGDYSHYNTFQHYSLMQLLYYFVFSTEFSLVRYLWLPMLLSLAVYIKYRGTVYKQPYLLMIGLGVVAFMLAVTPYILVGKPLIFDDLPSSRCAILVPFAAALLLSGTLGLFFQNRSGQLSLAGHIVALVFASFYTVIWVNTYLYMEAETAIKNAFVFHLKQHEQWKPYSIYWIYPNGFSADLAPHPVFYEGAYLLNEAYAGHRRCGYWRTPGMPHTQDFKDSLSSEAEKNRFNFASLDVNGPQIALKVTPGAYWMNDIPATSDSKLKYALNPGFHSRQSTQLGWDYLYYRFVHPEQMNVFLSQLIHVEAAT